MAKGHGSTSASNGHSNLGSVPLGFTMDGSPHGEPLLLDTCFFCFSCLHLCHLAAPLPPNKKQTQVSLLAFRQNLKNKVLNTPKERQELKQDTHLRWPSLCGVTLDPWLHWRHRLLKGSPNSQRILGHHLRHRRPPVPDRASGETASSHFFSSHILSLPTSSP